MKTATKTTKDIETISTIETCESPVMRTMMSSLLKEAPDLSAFNSFDKSKSRRNSSNGIKPKH
jgi:hypothetical protein